MCIDIVPFQSIDGTLWLNGPLIGCVLTVKSNCYLNCAPIICKCRCVADCAPVLQWFCNSFLTVYQQICHMVWGVKIYKSGNQLNLGELREKTGGLAARLGTKANFN